MNIHPLFVHFPIGLLVTYALLELASLVPRVKGERWVFTVKAFLVLAGFCAAVVAYLLGGMAEDFQSPDKHDLIEMHEHFAGFTLIAYGLLFIGYAMVVAKRVRNLSNRFFIISEQLIESPLAAVLALVALGLITVTGALGAAIALGPDVDPFVTAIYHFFFS